MESNENHICGYRDLAVATLVKKMMKYVNIWYLDPYKSNFKNASVLTSKNGDKDNTGLDK